MSGFEWVVAILAGTLAVLLVLSIILVVYLVKVAKSLRRVAEKAENVASNVEVASNIFRQSAGPLAISRLVSNIIDVVKDTTTKKGKK